MKSNITDTIGDGKLTTGKTLAQFLGVKGASITRLADRDGLPFTKVGRQRLYDLREVADWLDKINGRETALAAALRDFRKQT